MLLLTLLAPLALADPPLAIPPAPDLDAVAVPSEPPKTLSAALADYRRRSVSLRQYSTLEGGGTFVGWGVGSYRYGPPYMGMATTVYLGGPVVEIPHWAVFQQGRRLSVPQWMDIADAPEARDDLAKRVRRTRRWHRVFIGAAIVGGVSMVGTALASGTAQTYDEYTNWRLAGSLGTAVTVGSIAGAYGTGVWGSALRYDFDATQDLAQTREWVRAHNAQLREELHLTPAQTASIDRGE